MKLLIDARDYTGALDAAHPLTLERALNAPSVCRFTLSLAQTDGGGTPARLQRVMLRGDDDRLYFTGFVAADPVPQFAGLGMEGPRYRLLVEARSDEFLLDQAPCSAGRPISGQTAGQLLSTLATHAGNTALDASALALPVPVGHFVPEPGASFSGSAGRVASQARASYRALDGALTLAAIPTAVHTLRERDGTLVPSRLALRSAARGYANDVTICGEHEPAASVTEMFVGDGVTTQFRLSARPFFQAASLASLVDELWDGAGIDTTRWGESGGYFALGPGGLTLSGGGGVDGGTRLAWLDAVEMGGTLLLEAQGVRLTAGSAGILAAFFAGVADVSGCTAGFSVSTASGSGEIAVQPLVLGEVSGLRYTIDPANQYTLRVRVRCAEVQRHLTRWMTSQDGELVATGGEGLEASGRVQCEIQEFVNGVAGMPVTLYEGTISNLPGACTVVAASSLNLHGSMRALRVTQLGTAWVVSTPPGGTAITRRVGSLPQGAECHVDRSGVLVFYTGLAPAAGEQVTVTYRGLGRSVGRVRDAAGEEQATGLPGTAAWAGSASEPKARSSADCRNAAAALLPAAVSESARWTGTYAATNFELDGDVWPGDAVDLEAPACGLHAQLVVQRANVVFRPTVPELIEYALTLTNDWGGELAVRTLDTVPTDAWLPARARANATYAANLSGVRVLSVDGGAVVLDMGATPPPGGGFEVRRRDHAFTPGEDSDLVLRGTQQRMTLPRLGWNDRFYLRMFDGATPPNYSEFSAAVVVNLPAGA